MATYFIHHKSLQSYFIYLENPIFALICASFHIVSFLLYIIHLINPKSSSSLVPTRFCSLMYLGKGNTVSLLSILQLSPIISALNFSDIEPQKTRKDKTAVCLA